MAPSATTPWTLTLVRFVQNYAQNGRMINFIPYIQFPFRIILDIWVFSKNDGVPGKYVVG